MLPDLLLSPSIQGLILFCFVLLLGKAGQATPTKRAWGFLLTPIPILLLGFYWSWLVQAVTLYDGLLLSLLIFDRFILSRTQNKPLIERQCHQKFSLGIENPVTLLLSNPTSHPLQGWISETIPHSFKQSQNHYFFQLKPGEQQHVDYHLIPQQRGAFTLGPLYFKVQSRLGLLWCHHHAQETQSIKVYPNLNRLQSLRAKYSKSINMGNLRRRRVGTEGTLFEGLQNYLPGDDVRNIDWRATARLETPIVRRFTTEVDQPILLLLDIGRKMQSRIEGLTKLDWSLNALYAFAGVALSQGDQVGVGVFDQSIRWAVPLRGGKKQLHQVVEHCYNLEPTPIEPDYEAVMLQFAAKLKRRACVVIFTDLIDPWVSQSLIKSIQVFSPHHLVIILTFKDPEVTALETQMPNSIQAAYEKGVALDLQQLRFRSLKTLQQGGTAVVIDAPPQTLDEKLIAHYLSLKLRQKL